MQLERVLETLQLPEAGWWFGPRGGAGAELWAQDRNAPVFDRWVTCLCLSRSPLTLVVGKK